MSITNSNILCFKSSCKQCCVGPARDRQPSKGWGICSMCAPPSVNSGCSLFFLSTHLKFSQPHSNRIQSDQQRCWNNTGFLWYGESRTSYSLNYSDLHKPSAASPQTPGTACPWWSSDDIHRATAGRNSAWGLLHSSISSWSAHQPGWREDLGYQIQEKTSNTQIPEYLWPGIPFRASFKEAVLPRQEQAGDQSWLFSVGDLLPLPALTWVSKKGVFSLFRRLLTLSQNVTLIFKAKEQPPDIWQ